MKEINKEDGPPMNLYTIPQMRIQPLPGRYRENGGFPLANQPEIKHLLNWKMTLNCTIVVETEKKPSPSLKRCNISRTNRITFLPLKVIHKYS